MQFYRVMSLAPPIAGLVGAGMAFKNANVGAGLMAVAAVGIIFSSGIGIFSIICAGLLGIGAPLVFSDSGESPYQQPE